MNDRVVVITGGSRGIGRAAALAAAARGYRVVVGYASNKKAADEVVASIEGKNGKAIAVKCDVGHESDILALFKAADDFGTLGALVNNAGIVGKSGVRVEEMTAERIQEMMAVNVTGAILCAREAVKRMSTRFGGKKNLDVTCWFPNCCVGSRRSRNAEVVPALGRVEMLDRVSQRRTRHG